MLSEQRQVLRFLAAYLKKHGFGPSIMEAAGGLDISAVHVREHLLELRANGWVDWDDGKFRSLRILEKGRHLGL